MPKLASCQSLDQRLAQKMHGEEKAVTTLLNKVQVFISNPPNALPPLSRHYLVIRRPFYRGGHATVQSGPAEISHLAWAFFIPPLR